ncbi:hypothetical protein H5410_036895 [Solanum commersonii]|uniref:RNase H type-1 domain-containing protein n=1 Tax=Solanum commersonii TaxID=4109 RepID=A0A9J5Y6Y8_SOLCO|nr:hypothetical protein H5410_036895 [Solanum commersonii]
MSEAMALRRGLEYCIMHQYLPVPWSSRLEVKTINGLRINVDARVEHIFREGNTFADYLANQFFLFASTIGIIYTNFQELPPKGKAILHLDKTQTPNLRIRNIQNKGFNTQT